MNLNKKKALAARTLKVGRERIFFNTQRLNDIKEAITKQDMKDLYAEKAILIKEIKGRRKIIRRKTRRKGGTRKKKLNLGKRNYIILTRKLRRYLAQLKKQNTISKEQFTELRKEIRRKEFESLSHLKEKLKEKIK